MNTIRATRGLRFLASVAAWFALAAVPGCGGATKGTVKGKVNYNGAPVTGGAVLLYPSSGGSPFTIFIKPDGTFNVGDAPFGSMNVAIETDSVADIQTPPTLRPPKDQVMPKDIKVPEQPKFDTSALPKAPIPPKYKDPKTSGLTWEIKPGKNDKTFDLTD